MSLYERINEIREERGIAWKHINQSIGAYRGKLTELKNGKTTLTNDEIKKIAEILNVSADYLLGTSDEKKPTPENGGELEPERIELIELFKDMDIERVKAALIMFDNDRRERK